MMRLLACLAAVAVTAAAPQPTVGELMQRAAAARAARDMPGYLDALKQVVARMPDHPALQYNLARGYALNEDPGGAMTQMRRAADMGFGFDASTDPAMAEIKDAPGFAQANALLLKAMEPAGAVPQTRMIGLTGREPEGIVATPTGTLYVGTIKRGQIHRIDKDGPKPVYAAGGTWGVVGLRHDPAGNTLLACLADEGEGASRVVRLRLPALTVASTVAIPEKGAFCNDVAVIGPDRAAATDSTGGKVWIVSGGKATALPHTFEGPNGIAMLGGTLYVADVAGLHAVDLAAGTTRRLKPEGLSSLFGIDGMVPHKGVLLAVQTVGGNTKLLRLTPAAQTVRAEVLSANQPLLRGATTAAIAGGRLVVLSQTGLAGSPDVPMLATIPL